MGSSTVLGTFVGFIFIFSYNAVNACKASSCIGVTLYYESLCGDSMNFVKRQLLPNYDSLKDHLDITFIPYGKASHQVDETGKWSFACQHGPDECEGNKAQACGLYAIDKVESSEDRAHLSVKFVGCAMAHENLGEPIEQCATTAGLSSKAKEMLKECATSQFGDDLFAAHGDRTHNLTPSLSFVPTIVINEQYSSKNQQAALSNFKGLICGLLPQENKPSSCGN
ncbi:GILT-like protein 1 [Chelonus insularis]|uniref:GILT-like protein 1 n=1 Tax=Chelonus insularis TaxID=460826 RepID=UPI00158CE3CF|nr:GILT-like protein 1 [Chelonus insularis]